MKTKSNNPILTRVGATSLALLAATAILSNPTSAQGLNDYRLTDDVADVGLTYASDADVCWLQRFDAVDGSDTIVAVETAVGTVLQRPPAVHNRSLITVAVWDDPNDDGNPVDAVLVSMATGMVKSEGAGIMARYPVPDALVHGVFFVGAYVRVHGGMTGAPMDSHSISNGRAWFAISEPPGSFDPAHLANNFLGPVENMGHIHNWVIAATGSTLVPQTYCFPKVNSAGCTPHLTWSGTPSFRAGDGFILRADNVLNGRVGFLIYSLAGQAAVPMGGGYQCIQQPFHRTPRMTTDSTPGGSHCTGALNFDFNKWIADGVDPRLAPGTSVDAQFFYRDPFFDAPNNVGFTGGIHFTIGP